MLQLNEVTLIGVDCVNIERLILACEISRKNVVFGDIKLLTSIPSKHPYTIPIRNLASIRDYSNFMIKDLYYFIETKYALVIQWDGFLLSPSSWKNYFLNYDYIGAPWKDHSVGNGGFSLRSRALLRQLAEDDKISNFHPEDFVICKYYRKYLERKGFAFPSEHIALEFSVESQSWDGQFGFHQTDITKFNCFDMLDSQWHSQLVELYLNLLERKIQIQGI